MFKTNNVIYIFFSRPLSLQKHKDFEYKYVNARDMDDTDLLSHLQECVDFVHLARQNGGGALVHW